MDKKEALADLNRKVEKASEVHMTSKAEIVTYYQDTYGMKSWKQKLIHDLLPFTKQTGKNPAHNLAKRFDPQRLANPELRNKKEYEALGKTLPSIGTRLPKGGYKVTFSGKVKVSEGRKKSNGKMRGDGWAKANFTETISGKQASDLFINRDFDPVFDKYWSRIGHDQHPVTDFVAYEVRVEPID